MVTRVSPARLPEVPPVADTGRPVRLPGLDLMRAAAISLVVLEHGIDLLIKPQSWQHWLESGRLGVDAFFVLSGYLIGGMIFRAGEDLVNPRVFAGFLVGRWMRTLPLYYFILMLRQVLRVSLYGAPPQPWSVLGAYAIFGQNLAWPMPGYFIESWSLAVEEWFYLLLPLLVWVGVRCGLRGRRPFGVAAVSLLIAPFCLRLLTADTMSGFRQVVVYRLDAIAWGVGAAAFAAQRPDLWRRMRVPALVIALALIAAYYVSSHGVGSVASSWSGALSLTLSTLAVSLVLPWATTVTSTRNAWWMGPVSRIAAWSYAMYLTNLLIASMLAVWFERERPMAAFPERLGWMMLHCLTTLGVSACLHRWVESPVLAWRNRLGYYRAFSAAARR